MLFETSLGAVRGRLEGDCIRVARLRYAKAPTGDRRFALPSPPEPWDGVLEAVGDSVVPPQLGSRLAAVMGDYPVDQSEDCLHLDIWVPQGVAGPLPVIVFLHGGAFMTGGGSMACYDGAALAASRGVVVVNVSYRLGILGFLALEDIIPANLGLHDQIAALHFVRREIAAFGGDKSNVTVIGQSAGALSIALLLALQDAPALFDRAVLLSAPFGVPLRSREAAASMGERFLEILNVRPGDRSALCELPVETLLAAQLTLLRESVAKADPDSIDPPFMPVIDGQLVKWSALEAFGQGFGSWCPLVVGSVREEYAAFWYDRSDLEEAAAGVLPRRFETAFPGDGMNALARYRARRADPSALSVLADLKSDLEFTLPVFTLASAHTGSGGLSYVYRFDWQSPDPRIGACHCIELPFLFGNLRTWEAAPMIAGARPAELRALSDMFQRALVAFARSGDPASGSDLVWPAFAANGPAFHFDRVARCGWDVPITGTSATVAPDL